MPRSLWRVSTLPMQLLLCFHAVTTQLNLVWETHNIELTIFYSLNTGYVTNELHELGHQNTASECEDQLFASDCAKERSVERCTTPFFPESSRRNPLRCSAPDALSSNIVYGTDASLQATVLEHRASFTFLRYRSVGRGRKLRLLPRGQRWQLRPSALYGSQHARVGQARVHVAPKGANDGCRQLLWESCVVLSRASGAVLGSPLREFFCFLKVFFILLCVLNIFQFCQFSEQFFMSFTLCFLPAFQAAHEISLCVVRWLLEHAFALV